MSFFNKTVRLRIFVGIIIIVIFTAGFWGNRVATLIEALQPPVLPPANMAPIADWQSNQNWTPAQSKSHTLSAVPLFHLLSLYVCAHVIPVLALVFNHALLYWLHIFLPVIKQ